MVLGNPKKIDLSISSFDRLRAKNCLFIDKTRFIERFLNESNTVQLIVRQRRLGKSLNMDMLRCFLTDKEDHRDLFTDTYIKSSPVWRQANSEPVFLFDFKSLDVQNYKLQISEQIYKHLSVYVDPDSLNGYLKHRYESFINNMAANTEGLLILTELVYEITGKRSYILIDEYDKLLWDSSGTEEYLEIKAYETRFLSAGLKGNRYLEKALLTGVTRVSRESVLSELNNLQTYDLFTDNIYVEDFGLSDSEIDILKNYLAFDKAVVREWYNGIKINGNEIYNIFSVLSYLQKSRLDNYWGRSGTIKIIVKMMDEARKEALLRMLGGETIEVYINHRISLEELNENPGDDVFYSLLLQTGYLSLEQINMNNMGFIRIPNKELMNVWKEFVLSQLVKANAKFITLFDNIDNLNIYSEDVERFLSDRLSYFDIESTSGKSKTSEKTYHIFVLGLLSAYEDISYKKPTLSNRESGDGRYDILFERKNYSIIFEFKSVENANKLESAAEEGLMQINEKRYYANAPKDKPLIKTAIAFCGKQCSVKSKLHEW